MTTSAGRIAPSYAAAFRCIGAECEDPCCGDWDIPLDRATYAIYQSFPQEKLGDAVQHFVSKNEGAQPEGLFAVIQRTASGCCPFFGTDRLCSIQKEYGAGMLSATCSIYPRSLSRVEGVLEGSLSLSCPEAARNVLFEAGFLERAGDLAAGKFRTDNVFAPAGSDRAGARYFHAVRAVMVEMVLDRSRPLWQRLLLMGSLCRRMDEAGSPVGPLVRDYASMTGEGASAEMEAMPAAERIRLELVFELTGRRVNDKDCTERFRETFWNFVEGIGSDAAAMPGDDVSRFVEGAENCERFFAERPWVWENYLVNYIFQHLFPFGRAGSEQFTRRTMFEEWVLMTTQFAWVGTLLIGVAARLGERFGEADVVRTVQSFTRAVEHYPEVLEGMMEAVRVRGLASVQGMAILLRSERG